MSEVNYIVLSDVHFGAPPADMLMDELSIFLDVLEETELDVLFIAGDLFHMKLSGDSVHLEAALKFIARVFEICGRKNIKVRFIHGTLSHDSNQLQLISAIENAVDVDYRIFNTVDEEIIFDRFKVLYLPEEYVTDIDTYYHPYFSKGQDYDIIIGHGLVDKAAFIAHVQESEETRKSAHIFPIAQLHEICKGPIYFGHIHTHMEVDRFRYVSSYTVWAFGEPEHKGFMVGSYNTESKTFTDAFIVNHKAPKYESVKIKADSPLFKLPPQQAIIDILEVANKVLKDYVRIEVSYPDDYEHSSLMTNMLNEAIRNRRIKTKFISGHKEKVVEAVREQVNELLLKYEIIFDKSAPVEVKLSEFISIQYKVNIPPDEVKALLEEKLL